MLPQTQAVQNQSAETNFRSYPKVKLQLITSSSPKLQELRNRYETMQAASYSNISGDWAKPKS